MPSSFKFKPNVSKYLKALSSLYGVNQTNIMSILIIEKAKSEGIHSENLGSQTIKDVNEEITRIELEMAELENIVNDPNNRDVSNNIKLGNMRKERDSFKRFKDKIIEGLNR